MSELPPRLKVLYPFDNHSFETSGGSMNYVDVGEGVPVVMIHGNPTWSFFYRDLILELQDNYRCLALDNLGCGFSDKPQDGDYTLCGHIRRACEWLDDLNLESFHLVVHDWGGAIGMGVADKLRDRVKGITILNTADFAFPSISWRIASCSSGAASTTTAPSASSSAYCSSRPSPATTSPCSSTARAASSAVRVDWGISTT